MRIRVGIFNSYFVCGNAIGRLACLSLVVLLSASLGPGPLKAADKVFVFGNASHDPASFELYTNLAARLKSYGQVQVLVSETADKNWQEIPPGDSPWHEYACYIPGPWVYFPHPKIAPFIDAQFVQANRKLLSQKVATLQRLGLSALFESNHAHFLPEAFFQKYPELRGPRVDHPRRSRLEAFSLCLDLPETREMVEWMTAEIRAARLRGTAVLASQHQEEFCRRLGLYVVATFSAADAAQGSAMEKAVAAGEKAHAKWIIANLPEGRRIADVLADRLGATVIVFANFPEPDEEQAFDALVRHNVNHLTATARP